MTKDQKGVRSKIHSAGVWGKSAAAEGTTSARAPERSMCLA